MTKKLSELLEMLPEGELRGGRPDATVSGLAYDSRMVRPGELFFALDGAHSDGHRHVDDALDRGAAGVVHSRELPEYRPTAAYCRVSDARSAMARLAAAFYDHPSRELVTIGVTGTDGKSTTVWFISQLLESFGVKAGFLSTVSFKPAGRVEPNPYRQSTPESPLIHELLRRMRDNGNTHAVIEATSHGLSTRTMRLGQIAFDAAVITNVTHEHLEFHGSWEQYLDDKTNLFRALDGRASAAKGVRAFGVANLDDKSYQHVRATCRVPLRSYSLSSPAADFYACDARMSPSGSDFSLCAAGGACPVRLATPGVFHIENFLAAAAAVTGLLDASPAEIAARAAGLAPVPGRMQPVHRGQPFDVIVDYAHTPGAYEKLLPSMRKWTGGRLIVVFGSAGERDTKKRPMQGALASKYADLVVLADEDPRGEDPMKILRDIAAGAPGRREGEQLLLIPDRREAIRAALRAAGPGDTVLLLGKGHESSIILKNASLAWDEAAVAGELLAEMGYSAPA